MKGPFWSAFHYFIFFTLLAAFGADLAGVSAYWGVVGGFMAGVYGYRNGDPDFDWGDE